MKINRIKKENNFVVISTHVLRNTNLSWAAKGLHSFIMQLPDSWELTVEGLKVFSTVGRDGTAAALKELIDEGYVARIRKTGERGRFNGYEYNIYETPTENGLTENGKTVNGLAVNGLTENGKTATIKNEYNKELINEELKSLSDFDKSHPPTLFEGQKNNFPLNIPKEEKEKKVAPKKEKEEAVQLDSEAEQLLQDVKNGSRQPTAAEIAQTPTPHGVNHGVFFKLREFGAARQMRTRKDKRMTLRAWGNMISALKTASATYQPQELMLLLDYAIAKQYDSPFFAGYQDLIPKLKNTNHANNQQPAANTQRTTSERIADIGEKIQDTILAKYGLSDFGSGEQF